MRGAPLQFQQEILVDVVVFRHADVVSGKGADRLLGLPECDHQEMCGIALHTTERVSALVAGGRAVIGDRDGVRIRFRYSSLLVARIAPCQIRVIMRNSFGFDAPTISSGLRHPLIPQDGQF